MIVLAYLAAVILANLTTTWFGPWFSLVNSFLFIGLTITTRDILHERWDSFRWLKMFGLIVCGGVLSWAINRDAARIALGSAVAFLVSETIDAAVYQLLIKRKKAVKINGSNVASSIADSVLFPTIAFGVFMPWIVLGQALIKIFGGFVWSVVLSRKK